MIALDTNVFYAISQDCRRAPDYEFCIRRKRLAKKVLEFGKLHGCAVPKTVEKEARKYMIEEYAPFCKVEGAEKKKIEKFVDKLTYKAEKDPEFLNLCTPEGKDKYRRIWKAREGDWKIVAESMMNGRLLISFDKNIYNEKCKKAYREAAKEVGIDASDWDAMSPSEFLEVMGWEEESESTYSCCSKGLKTVAKSGSLTRLSTA